MTPTERLAELLEIVEIKDATPYTGKTLLVRLLELLGDESGIAAYRLVSGTLAQAAAQDPLSADAQGWLRGNGLDFSLPTTQLMIGTLAALGSWPDAVQDAVKSLGVTSRPRWQVEGYEGEPTIEDVSKELSINECRRVVAAKTNNIIAALDTLDTSAMTAAEVQTICDALIASEDGVMR